MKRVIGFGGVFFTCKDKPALMAWYKKHLGVPVEEWGAMFMLKDVTAQAPGAYNVWSPFAEGKDYFAPSTKPFMFNFMVADLHNLLAALRAEGVTVLDKTEDGEYGKFGWVLDLEGNKVELWEPPQQ